MTEIHKYSAPGSLLLLGEYAVLQNGGLGVAAAIEPRVEVRVRPAQSMLCIEGTDGIDCFSWRSGKGDLLEAVVESCSATLGRRPDPALVEIDSSALSDGKRKLGLGSSAAVAVAVTYVLLRGSGARDQLDEVFRTALRAHRAVQGGRGSGYDVAVSTYGGMGLFQGGEKPRFDSLNAVPPGLFLVFGDKPLATSSAVSRYLAWTYDQPADCFRHRRISDVIVRRALRTGRWSDALRAGRRVTKWLGDKIGVSVEPAELCNRLDRIELEGHAGKPAGAGGELAICLAASERTVPDRPWVRPIAGSTTGVGVT